MTNLFAAIKDRCVKLLRVVHSPKQYDEPTSQTLETRQETARAQAQAGNSGGA